MDGIGRYTPKRYPLNATVPLDLIVEVESTAKARKQPTSRCVEDLLIRGLKDVRRETDDLQFQNDLQEAKADEMALQKARKWSIGGRKRDDPKEPSVPR